MTTSFAEFYSHLVFTATPPSICDMCGEEDCVCDQETDEYRESLEVKETK